VRPPRGGGAAAARGFGPRANTDCRAFALKRGTPPAN